jgi:hypothetical protein
MKIKHSKYKNTGILFELLVRQATADTLKGTDSPAIDLIKKYFVKSELGREYKLYESVIKSKIIGESKANAVISTILESSKKLNRTSLRKQKYNLISEIKKNYNINNKVTLLEYLTKQDVTTKEVKEDVLKEFQTYDKDLRILTYQVLLEKFNSKYNNLSVEQKQVLKEFINAVDSTPSLREFYNNKIVELKENLNIESINITDKATQVKVQEISKLLTELSKNDKVSNDNLVDLLQYYELVKEIKVANGKV